MNIVSILIGIVALVFALPAFIPFFGILNWIIIPIALIGAAVGHFAPVNSGRNFCLGVAAVCVVRLWLGGGLL